MHLQSQICAPWNECLQHSCYIALTEEERCLHRKGAAALRHRFFFIMDILACEIQYQPLLTGSGLKTCVMERWIWPDGHLRLILISIINIEKIASAPVRASSTRPTVLKYPLSGRSEPTLDLWSRGYWSSHSNDCHRMRSMFFSAGITIHQTKSFWRWLGNGIEREKTAMGSPKARRAWKKAVVMGMIEAFDSFVLVTM